MKYLSIFIRVALLALGQSSDCHSASEVSLMDMGKSVNVWPQQSTAKQKPCAYFLGYTVYIQFVIVDTLYLFILVVHDNVQIKISYLGYSASEIVHNIQISAHLKQRHLHTSYSIPISSLMGAFSNKYLEYLWVVMLHLLLLTYTYHGVNIATWLR